MAEWGRILPLIILLVLLAVGTFIGLVVYGIVMEVKAKTKEKMEDHNVTMTRKGVTVGLKDLREEDYLDISQSILVDIWNHGNPFGPRKRRFWHRGRRRSNGSSSSSASVSSTRHERGHSRG